MVGAYCWWVHTVGGCILLIGVHCWWVHTNTVCVLLLCRSIKNKIKPNCLYSTFCGEICHLLLAVMGFKRVAD